MKSSDTIRQEIGLRHEIANLLATSPGDRVYDELLEIILDKMQSPIGYFGYINRDGNLFCPTLTKNVWDECSVPGKELVFKRENWGGLWGKSLLEKRTLMANHPLNPPPGHLPLKRAMAVPVMINGDLIGQITVANKAVDYTDADRKQLEMLADFLAPILKMKLAAESTREKFAKTRDQLREREEFISRILDSSQGGIFVFNTVLQQLEFINKRYTQLTGYQLTDLNQLLPNQLLELFHPDDRDLVKTRYQAMFQLPENRSIEMEYRFKISNGKYIWCKVRALPLDIDEQGNVIRFVGSFLDITESKQAGEILKSSEKYYRSLYNMSPLPYHSLSPEGVLLHVNQAWVDEMGYEASEVIGRNFAEFMAGKSFIRFTENFDRFHRQGEVSNIDLELMRRDGSIFVASVTGRVEYDDSGQVRHSNCVFQNITEQRRAEQALKESEGKYRLLADNTVDIIYKYNIDKEIITYVSPSVKKFLGYDPEEIMSMNLRRLLTSDSFAYQRDAMNKAIDAGDWQHPETLRLDALHKDEYIVPLEIRTRFVLNEAGAPAEAVGIARDITETKEAEESLRIERDRARHYLETVEAIIVALDHKGRISLINRKGCEIFGYSHDELIGQSWFEKYLPQPLGMEEVYPLFLKLIKGEIEAAEYFENPIINRDGEQRQIAWHNSLLKDSQGNIIGTLSYGEDITVQKEAEQKLIKSEAKYRAILKAFPDMMFVLDRNGVYRDYYTSREEYLYVPPDQFLGKSVREVFDKDLSSRFMDLIEQTIKSEEMQTLEYQLPLRERMMYFEARVVPFVNDKVVTIVRDITSRKEAENALEESEKRYRTIYQNTPVMLHSIDRDGRIISVSDFWLESLGYKREEVIGRKSTDFLTEESRLRAAEALPKFFRAGYVKDFPYQFVKKNGEVIEVLMSAYGERDESGKIVRSLAVIIDITELKRTENALRQSEEKYRALYDNAPLSYQALDEDGILIDVNPSWLRTLGYEKEEVVGRSFGDFLHPDYIDKFKIGFEEFKRRGYVHDIHFRIRHKDGHYLLVSFEGCIGYNPDGSVSQTFCVFQDITKRQEAEDALRETTERLDKFMEAATEGFGLLDSNLNFLKVNQAAANILGLKKEDFLGKNLAALSPDIKESGRYDKYMEVIGAGESFQVDNLIPHPKFGNIHLQLRAFRVQDGLGIIIADITDSIKVNNKLKETAEWLRRERQTLMEKNIALRQVLEHLEEDKSKHRIKMGRAIEESLVPLIDKLRQGKSRISPGDIKLLDETVKLFSTGDVSEFPSKLSHLSPRESEICQFISGGFSTKEIAEKLNLSAATIQKHREMIREKLGLRNTKVNLTTYLRLRLE